MLYIGRQADQLMRRSQHYMEILTAILQSRPVESRHHNYTSTCHKIYYIPLTLSKGMVDEDAALQMAVAEALLCLLLGSCQVSTMHARLRHEYRLPELDVTGANSTACLEAPRCNSMTGGFVDRIADHKTKVFLSYVSKLLHSARVGVTVDDGQTQQTALNNVRTAEKSMQLAQDRCKQTAVRALSTGQFFLYITRNESKLKGCIKGITGHTSNFSGVDLHKVPEGRSRLVAQSEMSDGDSHKDLLGCAPSERLLSLYRGIKVNIGFKTDNGDVQWEGGTLLQLFRAIAGHRGITPTDAPSPLLPDCLSDTVRTIDTRQRVRLPIGDESTTLTVPDSLAALLLGKTWSAISEAPPADKARVWVRLDAFGKRHQKNVRMLLSSDGQIWHQLPDASTSVTRSAHQTVWQWIQAERQKAASDGRPWSDGVSSVDFELDIPSAIDARQLALDRGHITFQQSPKIRVLLPTEILRSLFPARFEAEPALTNRLFSGESVLAEPVILGVTWADNFELNVADVDGQQW